ncbi:MAG: ATP-binding protein [Bacteroidetes bacterium]|nr:ATP-binding protein [Bacteroidota bacterium]
MEKADKHIKPEVVEINIPAKMEYIGMIRLSIAAIGERMEFSMEDIEDLKIGISEVCINTIQHGYEGENSDNSIKLGISVYPDKLKIIVEDDGKGFDTSIFKPSGSADVEGDEGDNSGTGFLLINKLIDEVKYFSVIGSGTKVEMIKYKNTKL